MQVWGTPAYCATLAALHAGASMSEHVVAVPGQPATVLGSPAMLRPVFAARPLLRQAPLRRLRCRARSGHPHPCHRHRSRSARHLHCRVCRRWQRHCACPVRTWMERERRCCMMRPCCRRVPPRRVRRCTRRPHSCLQSRRQCRAKIVCAASTWCTECSYSWENKCCVCLVFAQVTGCSNKLM